MGRTPQITRHVQRMTGLQQPRLQSVVGWALLTLGLIGVYVDVAVQGVARTGWAFALAAGLYLLVRSMQLFDRSDTERLLLERQPAVRAHSVHHVPAIPRMPISWRHHLAQRRTTEYVLGLLASAAIAWGLLSLIVVAPVSVLIMGFLCAAFLGIFGGFYHKPHWVAAAALVVAITGTACPAWLRMMGVVASDVEGVYLTVVAGGLTVALAGLGFLRRSLEATVLVRWTFVLVLFAGWAMLAPYIATYQLLAYVAGVSAAVGTIGWLRSGRLSYAKYLWGAAIAAGLIMLAWYGTTLSFVVALYASGLALFAVGAMLPSTSLRTTGVSVFGASLMLYVLVILARVSSLSQDGLLLVSWLGLLYVTGAAGIALWYQQVDQPSPREFFFRHMVIRGLAASALGLGVLLLSMMLTKTLPLF
jgi:hypothetical protein